MMTKRWFAKVYKWTPQQVEELTVDELTWLPIIEDAANIAQDRLQAQEAAHQRARH